MKVTFTHRIDAEGVYLEARHRKLLQRGILPLQDWTRLEGLQGTAGRLLMRHVQDGRAHEKGEGLLLAHEVAANVPSSLAQVLGLPNLARLSAKLTFQGRIDETQSSIQMNWYDLGSRRVSAERMGAFVRYGEEWGRLSHTIFKLAEVVAHYNATQDQTIEQRLVAWQPVQDALQHVTGQEIQADSYLSSLTIYQAGSFALDVRLTPDGPDFTPVLMSRAQAASLEDDAPAYEDGEEPKPDLRDAESASLLPPEYRQRFEKSYAPASHTRNAYVLGRNAFVVLDQDLRLVLDVVRRMRGASVQDRTNFVRNPRPTLIEALGVEDAETLSAQLFIETQQYSERVLGLGLWKRPSLPWLKRFQSQWLPEQFTIRLGGKEVTLSKEQAEALSEKVDVALEKGDETLSWDDVNYPIYEIEGALKEAFGERPSEPYDDQTKTLRETSPQDRNALIAEGNLEDLKYITKSCKRPAAASKDIPWPLMGRNAPDLHQKTGFDWLVESWISGRPGVLLADDMGLGKTYQTLVFLAWLRTNRKAGACLSPLQKGPVLIVAPTSLLTNWAAEAELHLAPGALGERIDAYGSGLKRIKRLRSAEWSPENALDEDQLRTADWILTTYETLADNHRAFARIGYSVAIFDEMQKIKDPGTINTNAAKTVNSDFTLGLTGTPIENRLEDLWCIMDRVSPGCLGSLKGFSETYSNFQEDRLKELKARLDQREAAFPPLMLRRMKEDHLEGLPTKTVVPIKAFMPDAQASAYEAAVKAAINGEQGKNAMLATIHAFRGISLHPDGGNVDAYDLKDARDWIERSARLSSGLKTLQTIEASGEKAIVFIEDRAVQRAFAQACATLLGLHAEPQIINGAVPGAMRKQIVDRFQAKPSGFDLLILSPKAAGIGLTITAANHVIHLSRWWNPAVEDQCNDRCYRRGQKKPVIVHIPLALHPHYGEESFDVFLHALLERKRQLSRHMLAPPVTDGDVGELFKASVGVE